MCKLTRRYSRLRDTTWSFQKHETGLDIKVAVIAADQNDESDGTVGIRRSGRDGRRIYRRAGIQRARLDQKTLREREVLLIYRGMEKRSDFSDFLYCSVPHHQSVCGERRAKESRPVLEQHGAHIIEMLQHKAEWDWKWVRESEGTLKEAVQTLFSLKSVNSKCCDLRIINVYELHLQCRCRHVQGQRSAWSRGQRSMSSTNPPHTTHTPSWYTAGLRERKI